MPYRFLRPTLTIAIAACATAAPYHAASIQLTSVTASFRCSSPTSPTFTPNPPNPCGNLDRVAGDNQVTYVGAPITSKTPKQNAYITSDGTFWFAQQAGSGRSVFFDFSDAVSTPQPLLRTFTTAWSTEFQPNWLGTPIGVSNGMWGMTLGQTADGTLTMNFEDANDAYRWTVRFDAANYPQSTNVTMTCTRAGQTCTAWTIDATTATRAQLVASTTSGKSVTYDEGVYVMPFQIAVTYP